MPNYSIKIRKSGGHIKFMENIDQFQKACKEIGIQNEEIFKTVDLYEQRNIAAVCHTLVLLKQLVDSESFNLRVSRGSNET